MVIVWIILGFVGVVFMAIVAVWLFIALSFFQPWLQAKASGVYVSFTHLVGMRLRKLSPPFVLDQAIRLAKAGVDVPIDSLEAHLLSGGDLAHVVGALVSGARSGIEVSFDQLAAIDLAGRDVQAAVDAFVSPRIIDCPSPKLPAINGVAKDGIRVGARVRITVRTNLSRLVGGAGENTISARVGQGIVSAIGSCRSHKEVLESPELISKFILDRGLDAGTAYEILSIDIADVDVLDNVGARLAHEQAQTDQQVAQARAEMRRVMAVAAEREMHAKVVDMTSQLTAAHAILPLAIADTCRRRNIWRCPVPVAAPPRRQLWNLLEE